MIGKKIGTIDTIFAKNSEINKYILMGLFDEINLGGDTENIQDDFLVKIDSSINMITLKSEKNKLVIQLLYNDNVKRDAGNGKQIQIMKTKHTFVIYYKDDFPVYNSEY